MTIKGMLDTNILIYIAKRKPPEITDRLRKFRRGEIVVSAIVWAEFAVGLYKFGIDTGQAGQSIDVLPFDRAAGNLFGKLTAKYPERAKAFDRMIAAHAISVGAKLITNNVADFSTYLNDGLAVENWV
ncbi:MAG: type II toxin-antitoxin system VapC family toxin [Desulfovibrionaceae bacterium]|jgi:tRNA(fMet)-specific endonuclease VapC|nr:type II toxin-antitoxin system VapC family toxin [Desulfovibrionaceae bacterium]